MFLFLCGIETTLIMYFAYCKAKAYILSRIKEFATEMYNRGYTKSQEDDTKQLLQVCKDIPYDYGNLIWKALTKTELPKEEKEEVHKEPIGFTSNK